MVRLFSQMHPNHPGDVEDFASRYRGVWAVASCTSSPQRQSDSYFVLGFPFPQECRKAKRAKVKRG